MTGWPGCAGAVRPEPAEAAAARVMQALVGADPARDDIALLVLWRQAVPPVVRIAGEDADRDT